jgi:hypothetical protein
MSYSVTTLVANDAFVEYCRSYTVAPGASYHDNAIDVVSTNTPPFGESVRGAAKLDEAAVVKNVGAA